jgi:hypothetical protein
VQVYRNSINLRAAEILCKFCSFMCEVAGPGIEGPTGGRSIPNTLRIGIEPRVANGQTVCSGRFQLLRKRPVTSTCGFTHEVARIDFRIFQRLALVELVVVKMEAASIFPAANRRRDRHGAVPAASTLFLHDRVVRRRSRGGSPWLIVGVGHRKITFH